VNKKNGTQIQSAWEIPTWCAAVLVVAFPSVAAAAVEAVLYSFAGGPSDGAHQNGYAVADHAGNLDGTTQDGGTSAGGTGFTAEESKIVTFDVPGSTCKGEFLSCTTVTAINSKGVLVGSYDDANGATHGYLRRPNGDFTTFNVPGSVCVPFAGPLTSCASPTGIDERDEITGSYTSDAITALSTFCPINGQTSAIFGTQHYGGS
jgi:hypothetical protein